MSIQSPKISIIIPVYKVEQYLPKCVDSILAQTYQDWELLLIDDGSPDNSGKICDEYAQKDKRIRVFHKENGGVSSARNLGLDYAEGKYIWFVDSDDWIENDAISNLLCQQGIGNADVCFFGLKPYPGGVPPFSFESILNNQTKELFSETENCGVVIAKIEQCGGFGWTCNKIFKNSIIKEHNIRFDQRFSIQEDHLFTLSYVMHVKSISVVSLSPYNYFMQEGTLLSKEYSYDNNKERNNAMYESRMALCKQFNISNSSYIKWFESDYATRMVSSIIQLKKTNQSLRNVQKEISEVNEFLSTHNVQLKGKTQYYRWINWLPISIQSRILFYFC